MKPIYATERADLSGWLAFQCPDGRPVIWDGGLTPSLNCLFNAYTLEPVNCSWLSELPNLPLVGWMDSDRFVAYDSVHPNILCAFLPVEIWPEDVQFLCSTESMGLPAPFFYSALQLADLGGRVVTPEFITLPENQTAAYAKFMELHEEADHYARHPNSPWIPQTSPLFVCSLKPPIRKYARLRDIKLDEEGAVEELEFWVGVSKTDTVPPLYLPDVDPDNLTKKSAFTLYYDLQGDIIGYSQA